MKQNLMQQLKDRMKPEEHKHTATITFVTDLDDGTIINNDPDELIFDDMTIRQNMRLACAINALYDAHYDFDKMYKVFIDAGFEAEDFDKPVGDVHDLLYDMLNAYSHGEDLKIIFDKYYDEFAEA